MFNISFVEIHSTIRSHNWVTKCFACILETSKCQLQPCIKLLWENDDLHDISASSFSVSKIIIAMFETEIFCTTASTLSMEWTWTHLVTSDHPQFLFASSQENVNQDVEKQGYIYCRLKPWRHWAPSHYYYQFCCFLHSAKYFHNPWSSIKIIMHMNTV